MRAAEVWRQRFPRSEHELARDDLAYFTLTVNADQRPGTPPPPTLPELIEQGWVRAEPIVYEDFLLRSEAGISVQSGR